MSSTEWGQPGRGLPDGGGAPGAQHRPTWLKLTVLVALLMAVGWVLLLSAQYCSTGKPLGSLPGVPAPLAGLFNKVSFQYVGSVAPVDGLQNPMGVAVGQDGRVYVTESGGARRIHIYNSLGQEQGSFAPPATEAPNSVPVYVAVSPNSSVYVSDRGADAIFVFSLDGAFQGKVTPPPGFEDWQPLGLTFDQAGNLYVTDVTPNKHRVIVMNPAGTLMLNFGSQGEADGQFWYPNGIAVDSQGRIYVADSNNGRMQAFDKDGNLLFKISRGMGEGDLSMPRGVAVDSDNHLIIADTSRGDVQVYGITGATGSDPQEPPLEFLGSFANAGGGSSLQFPNGLALDGQGKVYVVDRSSNQVLEWKY
jgi:tripartite motif-containing protein 71